MVSGQACLNCEKKGLLCTTAYFRDWFLDGSSLRTFSPLGISPLPPYPRPVHVASLASLTVKVAPFLLGTGSDDLQGAVLSDVVDIAALAVTIEGLYRQGYDIRATLADENLDVVLNMESVRERLRRLPPTSPAVSFSEPADDDRNFKCLEWSACVRGRSSHIVRNPRNSVPMALLPSSCSVD